MKMNRVNNKLQISNIYFSNFSSSFMLMQIDCYRQSRENEESKILDESEDDLMTVEVSNWWKRDRIYLELINKWDLINLNDQDILSRFKAWLLRWADKKNYHKTICLKYDSLTKRVHPEIMNIVISKYWKNGQSNKYLLHLIKMMLYEGLSFNESNFIDKLNRVEVFNLSFNT